MKYLLLLLLFSCNSLQTNFQLEALKGGEQYRKDMKIDINGFKGHGVIVAPNAPMYYLEVESKGALDLYTFMSCHRDITQEDAGYKGKFLGFGRDKRLAKSEFIPVKGIEDSGSCPIELGGYEKKEGRHSWGAIVLESPKSVLPSKVFCNGRESQYRGTSICQSRAGLLQKIIFPRPVEYNLDKNCDYSLVKLTNNNTVFEYRMPVGECVNYFIEKDGEKVSEHYDHGYTKILITE